MGGPVAEAETPERLWLGGEAGPEGSLAPPAALGARTQGSAHRGEPTLRPLLRKVPAGLISLWNAGTRAATPLFPAGARAPNLAGRETGERRRAVLSAHASSTTAMQKPKQFKKKQEF